MAAVAGWKGAAESALLSYAQILFSRSPWIGALLFLSTAVSPRACLFGLAAVVSATATAWLLQLAPDARREGTFGYNALLLGLGVGHSFLGPGALLYLVLCVAPTAALLTAALRALLAGIALPVLSLPFLLLYAPTLHGGARLLPLSVLPNAAAAPAGVLDLLMGSLGALFFLDRWQGGALVLLALLAHSRIAALLSVLAAAVVFVLGTKLPVQAPVLTLGYNAVLSAIALGGVFFVPAASSFALALFSVLLCSLIAVGAQGPLLVLGLPLGVLPFNVTIWIVLLALRQRARDLHPKAVDFLPGTPEENLTYARTRLLRFARQLPVRLRLPLRGPWLCTQGVDGSKTHKGPWRHGYDFEVRGEDGCLFREEGTRPEHYHAFRLPVLAAAAGVVARAVGQVPDNGIGELNLVDNWGNYVLIRHAPGLYSLVAHLLAGSVRVAPGQVLQGGEVIGLCGNSGRSPQPHVHFHLQASDRLGDATLPCAFDDVVVSEAGAEVVVPALVPKVGQELRNLSPSTDAAALLRLSPGSEWRCQVDGEEGEEHVLSEVDLYGRRCLVSQAHGATLYFELGDDFFTIYDVVGGPRSALHLLRAALPRIPLELEGTGALSFADHLPARPLRAVALRLLTDLVAPFLGRDGVTVRYTLRRTGRLLVVEGEGRGLRTRAEVALGKGPRRIEVTLGGRTRRLTITQAGEAEGEGQDPRDLMLEAS